MCIAYKLNGRQFDYLPAGAEDQFKIEPIYETLPGWKEKTKGIRNIENLPDKAKKYLCLKTLWRQKISVFQLVPKEKTRY